MKFQDVYLKYSQSVYRYLLALTGDESIAEELVQETFYRAFISIEQFRGECSIYTWLCQIGKNAWYREYQRRKRYVTEPENLENRKVQESVEASILRQEQVNSIMNVVERLEPLYADVFIMHIYGNKKFSEISKYFDKSESWARVTYYRAKAKIMDMLREF